MAATVPVGDHITGVGPVWDRWHVHGQCKGWMWWQNMGVVAVVNDVCGGQ